MNFCKKEDDTFSLNDIWDSLHYEFFPEASLEGYKLSWSNRRQKRTLASCNVKKKIVRVASELHYKEYEKWLFPLLHHEMCHAVMAEELVKQNENFFNSRIKVRWHGRDFKKLEASHPLHHDFQIWIKNGGWAKAIRSSRKKEWWNKVKGLFNV